MGRNSELIRQWTLLRQLAATRTNTIPRLAEDAVRLAGDSRAATARVRQSKTVTAHVSANGGQRRISARTGRDRWNARCPATVVSIRSMAACVAHGERDLRASGAPIKSR
jgi:hypothetical protein